MKTRTIDVCTSGQVPEGGAISFTFRDSTGLLRDGFVCRTDNKLFAYLNQCKHQPLSLDYGDNEFFDETGHYLLCRNHGALFEADTGKCIQGPCTGASLEKFQLVETDGRVLVMIPTEVPDLD